MQLTRRHFVALSATGLAAGATLGLAPTAQGQQNQVFISVKGYADSSVVKLSTAEVPVRLVASTALAR